MLGPLDLKQHFPMRGVISWQLHDADSLQVRGTAAELQQPHVAAMHIGSSWLPDSQHVLGFPRSGDCSPPHTRSRGLLHCRAIWQRHQLLGAPQATGGLLTSRAFWPSTTETTSQHRGSSRATWHCEPTATMSGLMAIATSSLFC